MSNYLILGGCGFIGRNLVELLSSTGMAKKIRVADKVMPALAGLSASQKEIYESDLVDYTQANLANPKSIDKAFAEDFGKWDVVVNCASETKYSQGEDVYKENVVNIAVNAAKAAKDHGVGKFIELSTGQVYDSGNKESDEGAKIKPWTKMAEAKREAEQAIEASGVPAVILRLATVYGPGDQAGLMPRLICAATYTESGEKMTFLWSKDMAINTVHVADVCAAIVHAAGSDVKSGTYNLVDGAQTTQGSVAELIETLFGVKTSFMGNMKSKMATAVAMKMVADTANEKHLGPWSDLCKKHSITNSPLTPYLDEELLYKNPLSLNGQAFAGTGFTLQHPAPTAENLKASLQYHIDNGAFPAAVLK